MGTIYKIFNPNHLDKGFYIGATTCAVSKRFNDHQTAYRRYKVNPLEALHYCSSFEVFALGQGNEKDCFYEVLEEIPYSSGGIYPLGVECVQELKNKMKEREAYHIINEKASVFNINKNKAGIDYSNKKNYNKSKYLLNKDVLLQKHRDKYKNASEEFRENKRLDSQIYYYTNREKLLKYHLDKYHSDPKYKDYQQNYQKKYREEKNEKYKEYQQIYQKKYREEQNLKKSQQENTVM